MNDDRVENENDAELTPQELRRWAEFCCWTIFTLFPSLRVAMARKTETGGGARTFFSRAYELISSWAVPAGFVVLCLLPFLRLLLPGDLVVTDSVFCDYGSYQLPVREFARAEFLSGRFPLWTPYLGCGMPLHAGQQASLCHPLLTPFVLLFGANYGLRAGLVLHLGIASVGAYLLARELVLTQWAAALAALVVTWGAFPVMHLMEGHVTIVVGYAMVPWSLLALTRLLRLPTRLRAAQFSVIFACLMLSGHPQVPYYVLLFSLFWGIGALAFGARRVSCLRSVGCWCAGMTCAFLLAAVQNIPVLELINNGFPSSERGSQEYASQYSMDARDIARLFVPNAMGNPLCGIERYDKADYFHERIGYVGVLPLFLAMYGFTRGTTVRWQWGALVLLLFGLTVAFGKNTPLFDLFGQAIPGLWLFRCPGRVFSVLTVLIAIPAAKGLDVWATRARAARLSDVAIVGAACVVLVLGVSAASWRIDWDTYTEYARQHLLWELGTSALTIIVAVTILLCPRQRLSCSLCYLGVLGATIVDLGDHAFGNFSLEPRQHWAAAGVRSMPFERNADFRVVDHTNFRFSHGSLTYSKIVPRLIETHTSSLVTNEGGLLPSSLSRLHLAVEQHPRVALAISSCNYLCSPTGDLWEPLSGSLPRIRFVPQACCNLIAMPIGDLRLEDVESLRESQAGSVSIVHEDPQKLELDVAVAADGALVVADLFYPGWHCEIDGLSVPIEPAHGVFRAVCLKGGEHRVVFNYRPGSFRAGMWCMAFGLMITAFLAFAPARRPEQLMSQAIFDAHKRTELRGQLGHVSPATGIASTTGQTIG
jgi:hypothetical protein